MKLSTHELRLTLLRCPGGISSSVGVEPTTQGQGGTLLTKKIMMIAIFLTIVAVVI